MRRAAILLGLLAMAITPAQAAKVTTEIRILDGCNPGFIFEVGGKSLRVLARGTGCISGAIALGYVATLADGQTKAIIAIAAGLSEAEMFEFQYPFVNEGFFKMYRTRDGVKRTLGSSGHYAVVGSKK